MRVTKSLTATIAVLAALAVTSCGSDDDPAAESDPTETSSLATSAGPTDAEPVDAESEVVTEEEPATSACPAATAVEVSSTNGGYPPGIDWSSVHTLAERGLAATGGDAENIVVYLATEQRPFEEVQSSQTELGPEEGIVRMEFVNGTEDTVSGTYQPSLDNLAPMRVVSGIRVTGLTTIQLSDEQGAADLVIDGDRVCGTFDVADEFTALTGTFVADLQS